MGIEGRGSAGVYGLKGVASMVFRRPFGWAMGSSSGFFSGEVGEMGFFSSWSLFSNPSTLLSRASRTSVLGPRFLGTASVKAGDGQTTRKIGGGHDMISTTHHTRRHIGRPCMPHNWVANDYI